MDFKVNPIKRQEYSDTSDKGFVSQGSKGRFGNTVTDRSGSIDIGTGFKPFVIIDEDDRTEVKDTRPYPYRVICALFMQFRPNGYIYRGTGTLIGRQHILTCAHNCINNGNRVIGMDVVPGHTPSGNHNMGDTHADHVYFPDDYKDTLDGSLDYAVIKLADPIGDNLGWMGYREASEGELNNLPVHVTGYPRFRPNSTAEQMYEGLGKVLRLQSQTMFHDVDAQGGQSGSAIYSYEDGDINDEPTIFGVHTGGDTSPVPEWNIGVRLNKPVIDDIKAWIEK